MIGDMIAKQSHVAEHVRFCAIFLTYMIDKLPTTPEATSIHNGTSHRAMDLVVYISLSLPNSRSSTMLSWIGRKDGAAAAEDAWLEPNVL